MGVWVEWCRWNGENKNSAGGEWQGEGCWEVTLLTGGVKGPCETGKAVKTSVEEFSDGRLPFLDRSERCS